MDKLSSCITDILWKQGILQDDDIKKCNYGLDIFLSSTLEVLSILIISLFINNFIETILFFTAFIPLRIYAGGYHAKTRLKCFIVSIIVYTLFTVTTNSIPEKYYGLSTSLLTLISLTIILPNEPVIHYNKTVTKTEKNNYKKICSRICIAETLFLIFLSIATPNNKFELSIALGQMSVAISMLIAIVEKKLLKN